MNIADPEACRTLLVPSTNFKQPFTLNCPCHFYRRGKSYPGSDALRRNLFYPGSDALRFPGSDALRFPGSDALRRNLFSLVEAATAQINSYNLNVL